MRWIACLLLAGCAGPAMVDDDVQKTPTPAVDATETIAPTPAWIPPDGGLLEFGVIVYDDDLGYAQADYVDPTAPLEDERYMSWYWAHLETFEWCQFPTTNWWIELGCDQIKTEALTYAAALGTWQVLATPPDYAAWLYCKMDNAYLARYYFDEGETNEHLDGTILPGVPCQLAD